MSSPNPQATLLRPHVLWGSLRPASGAYSYAPSLDVLNEGAGPDVDR
jgi:hypothetical protein